MKHLFYLILIGFSFTATGQRSLTVFTHEDTEFILFVNGVRKNATHETSVKATGITSDFVKLKVVLKDTSVPEITSSVSLAPQDDAVFELKKNKKGKYVLRFVSGMIGGEGDGMTDIGNVSADADKDESTVTEVVAEKPAGTNEKTSTVTMVQNVQTSSNSNVASGSISINSGSKGESLSINMTINEPQEPATVTTTTTTASSSTTTRSGSEEEEPASKSTRATNALPANCAYSYFDFKDLVATIKGISFATTQLSTAKQALKNRCITVDQSIELINIFSMEDAKLEFAKYAYDNISNKNQCYKTLNAFSFDGSKRAYNEYLESKQ